jgi:hypothetical protein
MHGINMLNVGIICLGVVGSAIILNLSYSNSSENPTQAETIAPIEERVGYTLREYDGKIGIFRGSAEKPYTYLDLDITYLNEYDRELLSNGIEVSTDTELKALIEDLTS